MAGVSCREEGGAAAPARIAPEVKVELVFPASLHTPDQSVNEFVQTSLSQCAKGDYEAFRSLWTARQEPITRAEFHEGWNAVKQVEVRALEKALLALGEDSDKTVPVFVLLVEVSLDESARVSQRKSVREIVLMLVREHDQWRLAGAPKEMREWIKRKLATPEGDANTDQIRPEKWNEKPPVKEPAP